VEVQSQLQPSLQQSAQVRISETIPAKTADFVQLITCVHGNSNVKISDFSQMKIKCSYEDLMEKHNSTSTAEIILWPHPFMSSTHSGNPSGTTGSEFNS
jgi:hypothetical protein